MAINLRVKTAVVRRTVTDPNNGHVYTIDGAMAVGNDAYGRCCAHVPTGQLAEVFSVTPAQTLEGGQIINGAMLNPVREDDAGAAHGWDQRRNGWDAAKNLTFPALVQANDIIMKVESTITTESRSGFFAGQSALHVLDHMPTGEFLLPTPVGWAGRAVFDEYPINTTSWLATKPTVSGGTWSSYTDIAEVMARASPSMALRYGTVGDDGYEGFSTYRLGKPVAWGDTAVNYGQVLSRMLSEVMLSMCSASYTTEQRRRICIAIARMGLDWGEAALRGPSSAYYFSDGAHFQWTAYPLVHALDLIGENASIPNVRDRSGGNMLQCWEITSGLLSSHFSPHTSATLPSHFRRRTLGAQPGGSVVRIPYNLSGGDSDRVNLAPDMIVTQFGGAKTATILSADQFPPSPTTGTIDITLTAASPFLSGEEVYVDVPAGWKTVGICGWSEQGIGYNEDRTASFSRIVSYRGLQQWGGQLMAICHLGLYDAATMSVVRKYFEYGYQTNTPSTANDFHTVMASWDPSNTANPFYFKDNHYVPL